MADQSNTTKRLRSGEINPERDWRRGDDGLSGNDSPERTPFDPASIGISPEVWKIIQAQLAPGEVVLCGAAWPPKNEDADGKA